MTLDESIEKAYDLLSEEEANEFLKGISNDDIISAVKMIWRGFSRLPKEDLIALIDVALSDESIVDLLKSYVYFPDHLREDAKEQLEELNSKEA